MRHGANRRRDLVGDRQDAHKGHKAWICEVRSPQDLQRLWEWMKQDGAEIADFYRQSGKGVAYTLPDSSRIGQRFMADSTRKSVLHIDLSGQRHIKIHLNPRGGVPEIPIGSRSSF